MKSSTVTAVAALSVAHLVSSQSTTESTSDPRNTHSFIPGEVVSEYLGSYASYFTGAEETSLGNAIIDVITSVDAEAAYTSFVEEIYAAVPTSLEASFISAFSTEDWEHITAEPWFTNVNPNVPAFETSVENIIQSTADYVLSVLGTPSALLAALNTQSAQSLRTYTYTSSTGSGSGSLTTSTSAPSTTAPPTTSGAAPAGTTSSTSTSKAGAAKVTGVAYAGAAALGLVGAMIAL